MLRVRYFSLGSNIIHFRYFVRICIRIHHVNNLIHFHHIGGRKVFRDFLRCEYSEENILFWLACEELKKETNAEAIEEKARFIYEDYISILSPKEVCVMMMISTITNK